MKDQLDTLDEAIEDILEPNKILAEDDEPGSDDADGGGDDGPAIADDAGGGDDAGGDDSGPVITSEPDDGGGLGGGDDAGGGGDDSPFGGDDAGGGDGADGEGGGEDAGGEGEAEEASGQFDNLDLRKKRCFGCSSPKDTCWLALAKQAVDNGWESIDAAALEKSLAKDVDKSYMCLAKYRFVNVNDNMAYVVRFDNNNALWDVEIADSPDAELSFEDRNDLFKSPVVKATAKKTYSRLLLAKKLFHQVVERHLDEGELLDVDDVKLSAILSFIDNERLMNNILDCKHFGD